MKQTMTDEKFDRLWQRAEAEGYAAKLSQEYPVWRTRRRRNAGFAAMAVAMLAVATPLLAPHHSGYGHVTCNRSGASDAQWAALASEMLLDA